MIWSQAARFLSDKVQNHDKYRFKHGVALHYNTQFFIFIPGQ